MPDNSPTPSLTELVSNLNSLLNASREKIPTLTDPNGLGQYRAEVLGKKSLLSSALRQLGSLSGDERRQLGSLANQIKQELESLLEKQDEAIRRQGRGSQKVDITLPGYPYWAGRRHPLAQFMDQIIDIFSRLGFSTVRGPEVETDYYNFEALNHPPHHPARDMQDTYYLEGGLLLRTHTSPVQVRVMEKQKPPIRIIAPGRVYRNEEISARSYNLFHQVEGLYVDKNVSFADLKSVLEAFVRALFGPETKGFFRPSYFPFTEPSAEMDIHCFICKGKGCRVCKHSGKLEVLGCGMVHPNVLTTVGIDPEEYTGFAFGLGVERLAMLKYDVNDIRLFYENDKRFLEQF
jgi:phenylalanyl-tRNA synthetase alpha chain